MTDLQSLGLLGFVAFGYLFTGLMMNLSDYMVARYNEKRRQSDKN
jgi:hypothetical protein